MSYYQDPDLGRDALMEADGDGGFIQPLRMWDTPTPEPRPAKEPNDPFDDDYDASLEYIYEQGSRPSITQIIAERGLTEL